MHSPDSASLRAVAHPQTTLLGTTHPYTTEIMPESSKKSRLFKFPRTKDWDLATKVLWHLHLLVSPQTN